MKVLVTGFQPFGTDSMNPAYEAVKLLPDEIAGAQIVKIEIPVVYGKGADEVDAAIAREKPDMVLCIGQAGGRAAMAIERVGINLQESPSFPDNDGVSPDGTPCRADGPDAYFSNLPVKAMVQNIRDHGIPAYLSYTAGTYVCNDVMYTLLYLLDRKYPGVKGGFIHVPFDTQQAINRPATTPTMPIATIGAALGYAVEAAIKHWDGDISTACGTTH